MRLSRRAALIALASAAAACGDPATSANGNTNTGGSACTTASCVGAGQSVIAVSSASVVSGTLSTISLQPKTSASVNAVVPGLTVVFTLSGGTSAGTLGTVAYDAASGAYSAVFTGTVAGTAAVISATYNGTAVTSTGPSVTVTPGAAAKLAFTVQPSNVAAGASITAAVRVTVQDAAGNTVTTATNTVTVAIGTNPGSGTLSGTASLAAVAGHATFSSLSINKSGTGYTLGASATGLTGASSSAFNVAAGSAAKLAYTAQPSNVSAGVAISPGISVAIQDAGGNTVTSATNTVTIAIAANPGSSTLNGLASVAAVAGIATFSSLSLNNAAAGYTLVATASGLTSATSTAFTVAAGSASKVNFTVHPVVTAPGAAITPAVKVAIQDGSGNTVTSATNTVTLAINANPAAGTLAGTLSVAAVGGIATFSNLSINNGGVGYSLAASSGSLTPGLSALFNIGLGPDLAITAMTAPATGQLGGSVPMSVTLQNKGNVAVGAFRIGIFFSTDLSISPADVEVAYCPIGGLAVGASTSCGGSVGVPLSLTQNAFYYVGAYVDDVFAVAEIDESNNSIRVGSSGATFQATAPVVTNGSFSNTSSPAPWVASGTSAFISVVGSNWNTAPGYAYLGADASEIGNSGVTGTLYQDVTIPSGISSATLAFELNITSGESTSSSTAWDVLTVTARTTGGAVLGTLGTFSNLNYSAGAGAGFYVSRTASLTAYAGQTIRLYFQGVNDNSLPTIFRIDDVKVTWN